MSQELKIIEETYELILYLSGRIAIFPRPHRYSLGMEIERQLRGILSDLIRCKYLPREAAEKQDLLVQVNTELEILRWQLRLARDLGALPNNSQRHALERIQGIGSQVGGWLRSLGKPTPP